MVVIALLCCHLVPLGIYCYHPCHHDLLSYFLVLSSRFLAVRLLGGNKLVGGEKSSLSFSLLVKCLSHRLEINLGVDDDDNDNTKKKNKYFLFD